MARGEAFVTCPRCNSQSRIPLMALQRNNYHCSQCGTPVPLGSVNLSADNGGGSPSPSRSKRPFQQKRKRR